MEWTQRTSIKRTIPYPLKKADRFTTRLKGLMFRKQPFEREGLWITPCNSVHMFFMTFPIDVIFLTREREVIKVVPHLKPWSLIPPVPGAHSAIELPSGSIRKLGIKVNDHILNSLQDT